MPSKMHYTSERKADDDGEVCRLTVEGLDLRCPLCSRLIPSGHRHECAKKGRIRTHRTWKVKEKI